MPRDYWAYYYKASTTLQIHYYMVAVMDYIEDLVLTKGCGRISTSQETCHMQGIIEDSQLSKSSLPTEVHTGYTQICAEGAPQGSLCIHLPIYQMSSTQNSSGR